MSSSPAQHPPAGGPDLTARGYDKITVARELLLSGNTVSNHVSAVVIKLEMPDRSEPSCGLVAHAWALCGARPAIVSPQTSSRLR